MASSRRRNQPAPPASQQQQVTEQIAEQGRITLSQSPYPAPADLAAYDTISPGLALRIVETAEREQAHRHAMEVRIVDKTFAERRLGQHYGLAIGIVAIIAGVSRAWCSDIGFSDRRRWSD
jgi:uncharacterized membrane protein